MISERTAFPIVVTIILLAALVVAPAAARVDSNTLEPGDVAYVGEENLNFGPAFGPEPVTKLVHYSDPTAGSIDKTILISPPFELTRTTVGTTTGTYYAFIDGADTADRTAANGTIYIEIPRVTLDVMLNKSVTATEDRKDSVDGKSVTRNEDLIFELDANLDGLKDLSDAPRMNVEVTLPGGGVTTQFQDANLGGIDISESTRFYTDSFTMSGAEAGTYTAQAKWPKVTDFYGKGFDSNTVAFEVLTKTLAISSNKDSVVCGKSFTVTITGEAKKDYHLFVRDVEGLTPGEYPVITPNLLGIRDYSPTDVTVTTSASGTRCVQFDTNQSTGDWRFTICVEDPNNPGTYDEVEVRVTKGSVTITAAGTGVYAIGEEITLSGTCTEGDKVYLFLTGPNLPTNGAALLDVVAPVEDGNPATFTTEYVEADDTWSYKWNTADVARSLDADGYTIYAVSEPRSKDNLSDARFDTTSIQLRPPSLTARTSGTTLVRGDDYQIAGTATGANSVQVWIIGPDYQKLGVPVLVESDSSFEYVLTGAETSDLVKGQYYVIIQHPVTDGFGVTAEGTMISGPGMSPVDLSRLQPSDAATALICALDSPNVDDIYIKSSFSVDDSWIWIDGLSDQTYGETFTVTGMTDYPAGTALTYRITAKDDGGTVRSGETVVADTGDWSFDVDTTVIGPGAYTLLVRAPDGQTSTAALFDVYDDVTHPVPQERGCYRVERVGIDPSLDDLAPGDGVALDSTISCCFFPADDRALKFSTDLQDPVWSYTLEVGGEETSIGPMTVKSRSFALSGWELGYVENIRILLSLSGIAPEAGTDDPALLRILERDADGRNVPGSEYRLSFTPSGSGQIPPSGENLTLHPGWNFVSVPRPLAAGNDTASIFASVETAGHSALGYDTANRNWIALTPTDRLAPLEGIWVYSTGPVTVPLNFSTDLPLPPTERALSPGWNAIGITGTAPATARGALLSVSEKWTTLIGFDAGKQAFETGIVSGESNDYADSRLVYQGKGYWLYMTGSGTLCAIGA